MRKKLTIKEFSVFFDEEKGEWFDENEKNFNLMSSDLFKLYRSTNDSFVLVEKCIEEDLGAFLVSFALLGVGPFGELANKALLSKGFSKFVDEKISSDPKIKELIEKDPKFREVLDDLKKAGPIKSLKGLKKALDETKPSDPSDEIVAKHFSERVDKLAKGWGEC